MIRNGGGSIINIASVASSIKGVPNRFVYGATKGAVIGLTKQLAADFIAKGIRCNAICPGHRRYRRACTTACGRRETTTRPAPPSSPASPSAGWRSPDEIAHLAVYLASDESAFVTGQVHIIDGGWTL